MVKWKSELPGEDLTWEPESHLKNAQELLQEFKARQIKHHHKTLYGWDDKNFAPEYLKHLEKAWQKWKQRPLLEENDPDAHLFVRTQTKWEGDVTNQFSSSQSTSPAPNHTTTQDLTPRTILRRDGGSTPLKGAITQLGPLEGMRTP